MTVYYDHQIFCEQRFGGISRYFFELIKGSKELGLYQAISEVKYSDNVFAQALCPSQDWLTHAKFKGKKDLIRLINRINTKVQTGKQSFDIFHPTYFSSSCLKNRYGKPMVITVLDMIDEKFHASIPSFKPLLEQRKKTILAANQLITISENTKQDLVNIYGINPNKIQTIYLGNSLKADDIKAFQSIEDQTKPYLLYVGSRKGVHKNFDNFLLAMTILLKAYSNYQVVFGGGGNLNEKETQLIKAAGIHEQVRYQPIQSDEDLISLYKKASLFVYPSIYEGFGLPLLEAFSCGLACAASNGSSISEVGGDAVAYFNPLDPKHMAEVCMEVLANPMRSSDLIKLGYQREKAFSWEKTVKETFQTYQGLIK